MFFGRDEAYSGLLHRTLTTDRTAALLISYMKEFASGLNGYTRPWEAAENRNKIRNALHDCPRNIKELPMRLEKHLDWHRETSIRPWWVWIEFNKYLPLDDITFTIPYLDPKLRISAEEHMKRTVEQEGKTPEVVIVRETQTNPLPKSFRTKHKEFCLRTLVAHQAGNHRHFVCYFKQRDVGEEAGGGLWYVADSARNPSVQRVVPQEREEGAAAAWSEIEKISTSTLEMAFFW
jgi:hypothetical protein